MSQHLESGGVGWYEDNRTRTGRSVRSSGPQGIRNSSDRLRLRSGSRSRKGCCLQELRLAIVSWIEGKYHRKRRQRRLGKLTPVEFETIMMDAVALAA